MSHENDDVLHGLNETRFLTSPKGKIITEKVQIRPYRKGGSILDIEQRIRYSNLTPKESDAIFSDISKHVAIPITHYPNEDLIEGKGCNVSKRHRGKGFVEISCIKEKLYAGSPNKIINNPNLYQRVLKKANSNSNSLTKIITQFEI